ncbi:MAG: methionyl-tRNA formyltransferase [Rickettsiales bacterium]|jgi:methionyl-tRNA formyltransferase
MKIILCLNRDIYCLFALNYLLPYLKNHEISIYFSDKVGVAPSNQEMQIFQNCEQDLSINNIEYVAKKSDIDIDLLKFSTLSQIEKIYKIFSFDNINKDGFLYLSKAWRPDLIISIRFGQIFKDPIISLPKFGIINLHSGILPNYRGILATFRSMSVGEEEIGTTMHFINNKSIDVGDIISISRHKADYKKSLIVNIFKLYPDGVMMIADVIKKIDLGLEVRSFTQDKSAGKYFSYPSDKDIKKFLTSKLTFLIDTK